MARTVSIESSTDDREEVRIVGPSNIVAAVSEIASAMQRVRDGGALARLIAHRLSSVEGNAEREAIVLEAMLPPLEILSDAATTQLRWNALARAEALREFGALTSGQLAEMRGARTANPHTTTSRWIGSGRVFAVETPSGRLFPAFQFIEGEPRPVIGRILTALGGVLSGWELLLWFTGTNGHLEGARPVDLLESAPERVVEAAMYQATLSED